MSGKVIINKKRSRCSRCMKPIIPTTSKYKIRNFKKYYHLSCYYNWVKEFMKKSAFYLKELEKPKYKKIMILENLEFQRGQKDLNSNKNKGYKDGKKEIYEKVEKRTPQL